MAADGVEHIVVAGKHRIAAGAGAECKAASALAAFVSGAVVPAAMAVPSTGICQGGRAHGLDAKLSPGELIHILLAVGMHKEFDALDMRCSGVCVGRLLGFLETLFCLGLAPHEPNACFWHVTLGPPQGPELQ
jgi:hypothetical protein